ncbi:MAG TPA: M48 family metalloprotease [Candidatus Sumerlaeota bacterium]|nr:M48 family metalloprotease [Candidatus Sumerlaeota bacterium]HPK01669.1 M48 family metalloprotease [Candidatus Sumerlaeota bacterium]
MAMIRTAEPRARVRALIQLQFLLAALTGLSGCTTFRVASESMFMISPEEERQIGQQVKSEIDGQVQFVNDSLVVNYVRDVGRTLVAHAPESAFDPQFFVIANPEINAFAIPAGSIYVHTGLISAADDEAEMAAVIAHEMGHVIRRHSARGLARNTGAQLAGQLLLGENYGSMAQLLSSVGLLNYTRQDEAEADRIAVATLHRAGYDPDALATFFAKLKERYGDRGQIATFFASHPPTTERINSVRAMVDQLPEAEYRRPTSDLRRVQKRLEELGFAAE